MRTPFRGGIYWLLLVVLAACSNGSGSLEDQQAPPPSQGAQTGLTIGGSVAGLTGSGLVLQNNAAGNLSVTSDGAFTFADTASSGTGYSVTVFTQPSSPAQTCTVANGTGTLASSSVTSVVVTCTSVPRYTIGVTVSGLAGAGLVLQNNAGDNLEIPSNGNFLFSTALTDRSPYSVTVATQPAGQNCLVRNATGTIAGANVTNVEVACAANQFTVGGNVTGLAGTGLVLQLNGANDLSVVRDGPFAFPAALSPGAAYLVALKAGAVVTKPAQDCVLANESGAIAAANVTNITVTCTTKSFPVGGQVSGLAGPGLVLQLNDANDLTILANGSFAFPAVLSGTSFTVKVKASPTSPQQDCTAANEKGVVGAEPVTTVTITCATKSYTVGGTVIGLRGAPLVLQNNMANDLTITKDGKFKFAAPVASGGAYSVRVITNPSNPTQACSIANNSGSGTITTFNVDDVVVTCSTLNFAIVVTVTGLAGSGLELRNGPDRLSIPTSGTFNFPLAVPSGSSYDVRVERQPASPQQTCTVVGGVGTVGAADAAVTVNCVTDGVQLGVDVAGLRSGGLVLQLNGVESLPIASDGSFRFGTLLLPGTAYSVTIFQQPFDPDPTNFCLLDLTASGTAGTTPPPNARVTCF
jgi:hypothetical protein